MPRRWQRRGAVNGKSDLNELRAEIAELRALLDTKASKSKIKTKLVTFVTDNVPLVAILRPTDGTMQRRTNVWR
jgi:hypothetical protein